MKSNQHKIKVKLLFLETPRFSCNIPEKKSEFNLCEMVISKNDSKIQTLP